MAKIDLTKYGITGTTEIVYNPSYEMLFEEETKPGLEGFEKGRVSELGAVNVMTGIYTGRSPKDKYIVMDENSKDTVWWTSDEYKNDLHLLISMPPQERPSDVIRVLKTQTSKKIHLNAEYDKYVKQYLFGDVSLWGPSYFIATTGGVTLDKIKEYVESQRTEYHKRKYEKTGRYKKKK